jgi:hypothetical protein
MTLLEQIREEVAAGRVTEQTHPIYPYLSIFKYADSCSYDGGWNAINRLCRGLILDTRDGSIVARSFPKFFNVGETPESEMANLPNEDFDIFMKMDGSMGSLYFHDGQWRVATPGSMDSPQAREATKMLTSYKLDSIPHDVTPVVEIIYPENRIVVDYGDKRLLILLTVFRRDGTEYSRQEVLALGHECGLPVVLMHPTQDINTLSFPENEEGYVIRFSSGFRVKVKSPVYVMAHRFLTNISIPRVIEGIRDGSMAAVHAQCPEVWRNKLDDLLGLVKTRYDQIEREAREWHRQTIAKAIIEAGVTDDKVRRKACALWINANVPENRRAGVFQLISSRNIAEWVWKLTEEELKIEHTQQIPQT